MDLSGITYMGPAADDPAVLDKVPDSLRVLLGQINGFILYGGALHIRGACQHPTWHSLRAAWEGATAFHRTYPGVEAHWVPFAEDCVGDQFFLADGKVLSLAAETGEVHATTMTLRQFLEAVEADPVETLMAHPLLQFRQEKGDLPEGQLIMAYPPFCTEESGRGVSLAALDAAEVHQFHAVLAQQVPPDGSKIRIEIVD
jgi:hypothetical protein